ncbi:MAG TPA: hypothetical protein VJ950_02160 [Acidimicrobiia bacterium]|nr:hypothetical protein [Acidimicrobiia bacterium]
MTTTDNSTGNLGIGSIGPRWLLVFGGVTRSGHRRARRVISRALDVGLDVVWFDGLGETESDPMRIGPLSSDVESNLVIVPFDADLTRTLSARMRSGGWLRTSPIGRPLWRFLRKVGSVLQPRACWLTVRADVRRLAGHSPPAAIVYTDDQSITSAWYASRIWETVPVSSDPTTDPA